LTHQLSRVETNAHNPRFAALIEQSRRSYRDEGGISLEQLRRELGLEPGAQDVNPGAFHEPADVKPPD